MITGVIGKKILHCDYCGQTIIVPSQSFYENCPKCNFPANRSPTKEEFQQNIEQQIRQFQQPPGGFNTQGFPGSMFINGQRVR